MNANVIFQKKAPKSLCIFYHAEAEKSMIISLSLEYKPGVGWARPTPGGCVPAVLGQSTA